MDKAEAIARIRGHMAVHGIGMPPHIYLAEALNMAIAALEADNNVGSKPEAIQGEGLEKVMGTQTVSSCTMCGTARNATT